MYVLKPVLEIDFDPIYSGGATNSDDTKLAYNKGRDFRQK